MNVSVLEVQEAAPARAQASQEPAPQGAPRAPDTPVNVRHEAQGLVTLPGGASLAEAEAQLREARYRPGFPDHLARVSMAVDIGVHRGADCPACCSRGPHTVMPWHRGRFYLLLVRCATCGSVWEG